MYCIILSASEIIAFVFLNHLLKREEVIYRDEKEPSLTIQNPELQNLQNNNEDNQSPSLSRKGTTSSPSTSPEKTNQLNSSVKKQGNKSSKHHLKLIVAVLSAPIRIDRREGIRRTWMKECGSPDILCRFFTDSLSDMEPNVKEVLVNESLRFGDIQFMPVPKGYNFGRRILWLLEWSSKHYEFDFFLRMDDDYFLCVRRLLFELPFRSQKR